MTSGMIESGFEWQVASATIPTFMTWASIWPKPAWSCRWAVLAGNENACGTHDGTDEITALQHELLDMAVDPGVNDRFVEIDLCLGEGRLCAFLLRRQQGR